MPIPSFVLNNGVKVPAVGYGTGTKWYKGPGASSLDPKVVDAVSTALKNGYTHIDGAEVYGTEPEIGEAIKKSGIKREDLFITTKVFPFISNPEKALHDSLTALGVDYVDLYLIHAPFLAKHNITVEEAWKKLEGFYKDGKVKAIGVSNFAVADLEKVLKVAKVKPAVHQIEYNAYLQNQTPGIVEFSKANDILVSAYSPLAPATFKGHEKAPLYPVLKKLAEKYHKSVAQVELRWVYQTGVLPITTSQSAERQKESLEIFDFELSKSEVEEITKVGATFHHRQYWTEEYGSYKGSSL